MALNIPFEISAVNVLLTFWRDDIPTWAVCLTCLAVYSATHLFIVNAYGDAEFWLSGGRVLLILILFAFTFITMVGGNPSHDAYSLLEHPRFFCNIRVYSRFCVFFIRGAICVGVILASNDPKLVDAIESETSSAASSPWIIAMENLVIIGLSHLATALMLTAVFSAGNTYYHAAMHALYGLAVGGRAPRLFLKTNARGVPIYCFIVAMAFGCLSFMQMSGNSKTGLNWLIRLTTTNVLINYVVISITYLCFYRACQAQGLDRSQLPYYARFQPYCGYVSTGWMTLMLFCYGYRTFAPWSAESFFLDYTMMVLAPILFISWKIVHKTRWLRPSEVDLQ